MDFDKLLRARHSVRKFTSKEPMWEEIIECIDVARFAPMAGNNYTLKFIIISDPEKIQKIAEVCEQDFISNTKYVVIVCSNPTRTVNAYGKRGEIYVRQQAGAGMQNFWLKLIEKGLSTCWIGHFVDYMIKEIAKIPENTQIEAIFPIGYEIKIPKPKKEKINLDNILYFDEYGNKKMVKPKKLTA